MIRSVRSGYRKLIGGPYASSIKGYMPRLSGGDMVCNKYPQIAGKANRALLSGLSSFYITRSFKLRIST